MPAADPLPRRFVLLDRDGTIIQNAHYLATPEQVELLPGAAEGLLRLQELGLGLLVVTNQSGVGRGLFDMQAVHAAHDRVSQLLDAWGVRLDGFFSCPHLPEDACTCRKPRTGMVDLAMVQFDFDPAQAFVVGDKACDIELGESLGAVTLLVRTGHGASEEAAGTTADYVVNDLMAAAEVIAGILQSRRE